MTMKKPPILQALVVFVALFSTQIVHAQVDTGFPPFASFGGGGFDQVNLQDLNVHFGVGVASKPGRGMSYEGGLAYDSSIWFPQMVSGVGLQWRPVKDWGWTASWGTKEIGRGLVYDVGKCLHPLPNSNNSEYLIVLSNYVYYDGNGTPHHFSGQQLNQCTLVSDIDLNATDGSGYRLRAHNDLDNP